MKTDDAERILKLLADSLEQGKQFALDQAPEVAQELIFWKRCEWVITLVGLWLLSVAVYVFSRVVWAKAGKCKSPDNEFGLQTFSWAFFAVACSLFIGSIGQAIADLQVWLAPKLYIVEYAANILK